MKNRACIKLMIITLLIALGLSYGAASRCKLSDREAKQIAKQWLKNFQIKNETEPYIENHPVDYIVALCPSSKHLKRVSFGADHNYLSPYVAVDCQRKEITTYRNSEVLNALHNRYPVISSKYVPPYRAWPEFISEKKATQIVQSIGQGMHIPRDMFFHAIKKFDSMREPSKNGLWIATWVRQLNGYQYEKDRVTASITGIDGQLVEYETIYLGRPCPTDVKIKKEDAIAAGWTRVKRVLWSQPWRNKAEEYYELVSAELLIVQPQSLVYLDCLSPLFTKKNSRLAWVIKYGFKNWMMEREAVGYPEDLIEVKIDAATGKLIGGTSAISTEK